ncbi:MAG TPA: D-arabinono-1,4-lactone oxidase [Actinocrinis sp.]|nr:D-arabinono-1,4-lactone oxidase [Actinocrinis sp.]
MTTVDSAGSAGSGTTRNWAGNITFGAARVHRPASLDELRRTVAAAPQVRALGSGHSFNRIADTSADLVALAAMPREIAITPATTGGGSDGNSGNDNGAPATATVAAGLRYAEIAEPIQAAGFALANMASLPHISVAGAVATGTHGSGRGVGSLATAVSALRMVGPEGDVFELSRAADPERFDGAVVALGALGIVTHVTLDLVPTFDIAQRVYAHVPLDAVAANYEDEVSGAAYSVSVFTNWQSGGADIWVKQRTGDPRPAPAADWLGGRLSDVPRHPVPGMPAEYCTEQLGVPGPWHARLPHFRADFTPSAGEELQSEFLLPRAAAPAAFEALRGLGDRLGPVLHISEVRTIAADGLWLSPAYGRESVAFHFTWIEDAAAVDPVLDAVEERLLPLGARPHWGKVFHTAPAHVAGLYEHADDFRGLMHGLDPAGKFRNPFTDAYFPARG